MSDINVIEFYSRLGVNPYVYIGTLAAVVIVVFLIGAMIYAMLSKSAFAGMSVLGKNTVSVHAKVVSIDIVKGEQAKAVFEGKNGEDYTLVISKINAAFLTIHDEGKLSFRGDRFVSFKRIDESAMM